MHLDDKVMLLTDVSLEWNVKLLLVWLLKKVQEIKISILATMMRQLFLAHPIGISVVFTRTSPRER